VKEIMPGPSREILNGLALIPPPPEEGSVAFT